MPPRAARLLASMWVATLVVVGACSSDETSTSSQTSVATDDTLPLSEAVDRRGAADVAVAVGDNVFDPRVVRVDPGATVTWTNGGFNSHNVIASEKGQFDDIPTGELEPGMSGSRTFTQAGVYPYYCSIHGTPTRGQRGVVVVGDEGL